MAGQATVITQTITQTQQGGGGASPDAACVSLAEWTRRLEFVSSLDTARETHQLLTGVWRGVAIIAATGQALAEHSRAQVPAWGRARPIISVLIRALQHAPALRDAEWHHPSAPTGKARPPHEARDLTDVGPLWPHRAHRGRTAIRATQDALATAAERMTLVLVIESLRAARPADRAACHRAAEYAAQLAPCWHHPPPAPRFTGVIQRSAFGEAAAVGRECGLV